MSHRREHPVIGAPLLPFREAALEQMHDAVVVVDGELRVVAWNRAATELYGLQPDEAIGRRFTDNVTCLPTAPTTPQERSPRRSSRSSAVLEAVGLVNGPAEHVIGRSGCAVPVQVSILPLRRRRGVSHFVAMIRGKSEQARLHASLQERLDFEILLSELSDRFSQVAEEDIDGEIERWLARLVEALDVDRGSFSQLRADGSLVVTHAYAVPGHPPAPLGPGNQLLPWLVTEIVARRNVVLSSIPDDLPPTAEEERRYFEGVGLKAGISIPVTVMGAPMCVLTFGAFRRTCNWPPEVIARLSLAGNAFANAVARKLAKQRLEEKQHELVHLGRVAAMGELASVIAHELDQPVTVIVSNAEALRHTLRADTVDLVDTDEALREIVDAAMRLSEIIHRERELLRKSAPSIEPLDLNAVVGQLELFLRAESRQFGTRLVLELQPGLPAVLGDRVQLQQVVFNLTRNGLQAMQAQAGATRVLTLRTTTVADEVTLDVVDAGPAVDPLVVRRMFEPFYTTKVSGLGMGLSISKSIIERHGGRIQAAANPAGGLTMCVSLPRK